MSWHGAPGDRIHILAPDTDSEAPTAPAPRAPRPAAGGGATLPEPTEGLRPASVLTSLLALNVISEVQTPLFSFTLYTYAIAIRAHCARFT